MSAISHSEAASSATATRGKDGERKYTAPYNVTVEHAHDGPIEILSYLEEKGIEVGTTFRYGAEADSGSFAESIRPVRKAKSLTEWTVIVQYSTPSPDDDQTNDEGTPTADPLEWRWDLSFGSSGYAIPVWMAWNVNAFAGGYIRAADTLGPVVNSAGAVLDPPLMRQGWDRIFSLTGNQDTYSEAWTSQFVDTINETNLKWSPVLVQKYGFTQAILDAYTVKCTAANATFRIANNVAYWQYNYEFRIRERATLTNPQDGWLDDVLDRGYTRRMTEGQPDGEGGSYSAGDLDAGVSSHGYIRDRNGGKTPELVLLDGAGQPAVAGSDNEKEGHYNKWRIYPFNNFRNIPFYIFDKAA